jgi:uncharacterized protein YacL
VFVEIVRLVVVLLATAGGFGVGRHGDAAAGNTAILGAVLGALVGYVAGGLLGRMLSSTRVRVEERVGSVPAAQLLAGAAGGGALGLIALLASLPLAFVVPGRWPWLAVALVVWLGVAEGVRMGARHSHELVAMAGLRPAVTGGSGDAAATLVDTSAIIDGRLLAAARARFLHGPLLVPRFVLDELQAIADHADPARRRRGRRGLETLAALRQLPGQAVQILDDEVPEHDEVDAKLVALARRLQAALVTVDAPLQRVAELQGVRCVNLVRLGEGLRPVHLPGEAFLLHITRTGREAGQGVGFLDDGTMVVVSGAAALVGEEVAVQVTSGTQTSMGRMLFASVVDEHPAASTAGADL